MGSEPAEEVLEALLAWWEELRGEAPEARDFADWLWLHAGLGGAPLPRGFTAGRPFSPLAPLTPESRAEDAATAMPPQQPSPAAALPPAPPDPPAPVEGHWPTFFPEALAGARQEAEPLARLLSPSALPDGDDVREHLRRRPGALPLRLSEVPLLPRPMAILQALRPLLRKHPHPRWQVLDEERSALRSAEVGAAWPVFRPKQVPALTVRLLRDGGVSMAVWQPLVEDVRRVLASSQAFARVELGVLDPGPWPVESRSGGGGAVRSRETTLTLLLSDTAGRHWWDGTIQTWLAELANHQPLAILHTLPLRYWTRTALGRGEAVSLSNGTALAPNSAYRAVSQRALNPWKRHAVAIAPLASGLKLPVLTLDPRDLAPWAALVMGDGLARVWGTVMPINAAAEPVPVPEPVAELTPARAEALWLAFRQQAGSEAQRLMALLAAAPLLSLPVMRLLLAAEVPEATTPLPLAEVLVSGLLRRLPTREPSSPETLQFELPPALQTLLEAHLAPRERLRVIQAITDLLERRWNRQGIGPSFETLLTDPGAPWPEEAAGFAHIANVTAAMLDRLPGQPFRELAERLRAGAGRGSAPIWPNSFVFQPLAHRSARLVAMPEPETIPFQTTLIQSIEPRRIAFVTATVAIDRKASGTWRGEGTRIERQTGTAEAFFEPLQREALPFGATAERADPLALTLVAIPAGSFEMGAPPNEEDTFESERPQHLVTLESFFISHAPITQAQWREVAQWREREGECWGRALPANPSFFQPESERSSEWMTSLGAWFRLLEEEITTDQRPVEGVSWHDAMEFCQRLSQRTGRAYTLPSEAQWEYACRAGTTTPFAFGETLTPELANYFGGDVYGQGPRGPARMQTWPVESFPANAWGLVDMHGTVWEWCLDHWHDSYAGAPADGSAWLIEGGTTDEEGIAIPRLLRGGSWDGPRYCRSAYRGRGTPGGRNVNVGFRVCCLPQAVLLYP